MQSTANYIIYHNLDNLMFEKCEENCPISRKVLT